MVQVNRIKTIIQCYLSETTKLERRKKLKKLSL